MRGTITSCAYEDSDWSPKNRKPIFYADMEQDFTINPWSDAELLSPEFLTDGLPDFNWFGGHSGRKLDDEAARKLDDLWFEYIDSRPSMFSQKEAWIGEYVENLIPPRIMDHLIKTYGKRCEICGYSYSDVFGSDNMVSGFPVYPTAVVSPGLSRLFFNICRNCHRAPNDCLAQKIKEK